MTLVRIEVHAAAGIADAAQALFVGHPHAIGVTRLRDASVDPVGDVVACDVPREAASVLLDGLDELGATSGANSVSVDGGLSHVCRRSHDVEREARGTAGDALLWSVVEDALEEEVGLSIIFVAFMVLATLLAVIGVVTNSAILVVGAMVIGPEFGPIATVCVALLGRRWRRALHAWSTVTVGFAIAFVVGAAFTVALRSMGIFGDELVQSGLVQEVASPNWLTFIIALIAGVAGMLSLTSARTATLVGVLISVTTIPAVGDAAALLAYGEPRDALSALGTLAINLTGIAMAGLATLLALRALEARRLARTTGR